ncbi:MAG: selenium metabolism-associated LysR family transcriptional regulator [Pseudomonadota bacterium]
MDLWQLNVFVNVVKQKSFSKAGETIHLSQPTVSSHIKELEDHFGCRLIDRLGREAVPTKAGEILFSYAKKLLGLKDETETAISSFLGRIRGHLTIGGSTIPAGYILPKYIGPFAKQYPDVTITLLAGDTAEIVRTIARGETEAGIVGARVSNPQVVQEKIIEDEMKLIVPGDHKWADLESIPCKMLFEEPFLARESGSGTWASITQSMVDAGLNMDKLKIVAHMGNTVSVIQGIINQAGISILSTIAVEDALESGRLKALYVEGLNLKRDFYLTTNRKRTLSPISETFIAFLKASL